MRNRRNHLKFVNNLRNYLLLNQAHIENLLRFNKQQFKHLQKSESTETKGKRHLSIISIISIINYSFPSRGGGLQNRRHIQPAHSEGAKDESTETKGKRHISIISIISIISTLV